MSAVRCVGLDTSLTATGVVAADGKPITIKPRTSGMPSRLDELVNGTIHHLRPCGADVAAVEGLNPHGIQGMTMAKLGAAREILCWAMWRDGIVVVDIPPSNLKLYATGKGNAPKEEVWDAAVAASPAGLEPRTNDEGDAFWLRQIALANYAPLHPDLVEMPDDHRRALVVLHWPKLPEHLAVTS
ncbi:MAG: hypothetical protein JWN67_4995 [Actinomycetia bacterium]|nr:hypothetical protein [Actinomycetes bacterium]